MTTRLGAIPQVASQDRLGGLPVEVVANALDVLDQLPRAIASPQREVQVQTRDHFSQATGAALGDTFTAISEFRPAAALVNATLGVTGGVTKDLTDAVTAKEGGSVIVRDTPRSAGGATRHGVQRVLTNTDQAL